MRLGRASRPSVRLLDERGVSFTAVLVALLIGAALYLGYFGFHDRAAQRSVGITAIDTSRTVACRSNRQTLERALIAWSATHEGESPTLEALAADGVRIPSCPEGGTYSLVGREVRCSLHR
jgi:23S rRNA C2498 (ribose-2'-O)-methylase RlmM